MKRFLIKSIMFAGIIGAVIFGVELCVPYYWGDTQLYQKAAYYIKHRDDYNTLFLGSSHVLRHIAPTVFDDLTDGETRSFNLGVGGMGSLESFALYDNLLKYNISQNTKYVFMELVPIEKIALENMHSERVIYFLNAEYYNLAVNYFKTSDHKKKDEIIKNYTISYREKILKTAVLKKMLMMIINPPDTPEKLSGKHNDGFYSTDEEYGSNVSTCEECRLTPEIRDSKVMRAKAAYEQIGSLKPNVAMLQKINDLIEKSKNRSIHLIFFLDPTSSHDHKLILPIYNQIDNNHKIDLSNPTESSDLYSLDIFYDRGHYNYIGAKLFTEKLAHEFNEILIKLRISSKPDFD